METNLSMLHLSCIFLLILFLHPFLLFAKANSSLPFFLKDLVETPKWKEANGISNLKRYLSNLGYINHNNRPESNSENSHHNIFDDELEQALKKYQDFYGLQVTGSLDQETIRKLSLPRCGVSDIIPLNRSASQLYNQIPFSSSLYTFFPDKSKWSSTNLTYSYHVGTHTDAIKAINDAFRLWVDATKLFIFTYTTKYKIANITINFQRRVHGDGNHFDGPGGIVGHSLNPPFGKIHLDEDEAWINGAVRGKIDLQSVVLHELGHALGLSHSKDSNALMYPSFVIGTRKLIGRDDINGMKDLYRSS